MTQIALIAVHLESCEIVCVSSSTSSLYVALQRVSFQVQGNPRWREVRTATSLRKGVRGTALGGYCLVWSSKGGVPGIPIPVGPFLELLAWIGT